MDTLVSDQSGKYIPEPSGTARVLSCLTYSQTEWPAIFSMDSYILLYIYQTHSHARHIRLLSLDLRAFLTPCLMRREQMDLADRVVSLAKGMYDDATALVVVFE